MTAPAPLGDRPALEAVDHDALHDADASPVDRRGGKRRRPTGEPPPLPREQRWQGVRWALVAAVVTTGSLVVFTYLQPEGILGRDEALTRWVVDLRTPLAADLAAAVDTLTDPLVVGLIRWGTIVALLLTRRLRFLLVYVLALLLVEVAADAMNAAIQRPRPMVEIVGAWEGFSHPSRPIVALTVTLLGSLRVLAPHGPVRRLGALAIGIVVVVVGLSRVVLGVDHVSDVVVAAAMAAGVTFALTRLLVPHARHPVEYRRGQSAHVTLSDRRVTALRQAVGDQLGLQVDSVELFAADGSAGSTPLQLEIAGERGPTTVFAKLYTGQHQRSDRLYKFVRLLMYGRLEDEVGFGTVRHLVQHEDHISRLLRDAGVAVPEPLGIVEITPEQEYLIAFEMVAGSDFDIDQDFSDELVDGCLAMVERLWVAGVAHRDIKPGNLLVDGDTPTLIDVAFAQVRPSPWRQAVDLGAMLLMLALAVGPERVHRVAMGRFSEEEIAEALAASDGVVVPAQLRGLLDANGWAVRDGLRALVPDRAPIRIQRWDRRRLLAATLTVAAAVVSASIVWSLVDLLGLW